MQHSVSFDPDKDELSGVLAVVLAAYGTTLAALAADVAGKSGPVLVHDAKGSGDLSPSSDGAKSRRTFQQWTEPRVTNFLSGLTPIALDVVSVVTAYGCITTKEVMELLNLKHLQGHLASIGSTMRSIKGLKNAQVWTKTINNNVGVYTMPEPLREMFADALTKLKVRTYLDQVGRQAA